MSKYILAAGLLEMMADRHSFVNIKNEYNRNEPKYIKLKANRDWEKRERKKHRRKKK